ncbi:MAG: hypothetical protein IPJ88_07015 [Myxococcales bacterium]|nr:MAG: hypothetical protein IPJ88_07015 [Myxococcales bacterium]
MKLSDLQTGLSAAVPLATALLWSACAMDASDQQLSTDQGASEANQQAFYANFDLAFESDGVVAPTVDNFRLDFIFEKSSTDGNIQYIVRVERVIDRDVIASFELVAEPIDGKPEQPSRSYRMRPLQAAGVDFFADLPMLENPIECFSYPNGDAKQVPCEDGAVDMKVTVTAASEETALLSEGSSIELETAITLPHASEQSAQTYKAISTSTLHLANTIEPKP